MRFFHYLGQSQIKMKTVLSKFAGLSALLIGMLLVPCLSHAEETATQKLLASLNLNREDIRVYQKVFDALKAQNFSESDRLTKKLNNKLLLGHILAEKYLAPKYKSNYEELALWLEQYADHPQAKRIYRLAQRKKQDRELSCPVEYPQTETFSVYHWDMRKFSGLSAANKNFLLKKLKDFRRAISRGKTKQARLILENGQIKKLLPDIYYSRLANILATKYLTDNYNRLALEWARNAARRNNNASSRWTAGIAAWRLKEYKTAASEFSRVSAASRDDEWISSAGDFWASRAYQKQKNSSQSKTWLKKAARYPRTFYGILAARKLGEMPHYNWEKISYFNDFQQKGNLENLVSSQALQRIVALIFTGQEELVRQEIGACGQSLSNARKEALLFLASHYQMHSVAIMLSKELTDRNGSRSYDHAGYPLPQWQPRNGWKIDPALVWALSRQESSFRPYASSPAGACGLMQLLPSTAAYISGNKKLRQNQSRLFTAEYNLELGQEYVSYLMDKPFINGNLLYMMTAYNAGPGNLYKWLKTIKDNNDPLLFMEIIPSQETRIYLERVMANYWIYQMRLNQPTLTLDLLSEDQWPVIIRR